MWTPYHHSPTLITITCTFYILHSTEQYSRQQFLNHNILYTSLVYRIPGTLTKTIWLLTVEWPWHIAIKIYILVLTALRWPYEWPKHGHYVMKLHPQIQVHFLVFLITLMHLINAWNMEHIKMIWHLLYYHHTHPHSTRKCECMFVLYLQSTFFCPKYYCTTA
jgi:hypothetical protein